jgi:hypothetical protein
MRRVRQLQRLAADYDQQSLLAPAHQRPMFKLLADSYLGLAARQAERDRLGEGRSFASTVAEVSPNL